MKNSYQSSRARGAEKGHRDLAMLVKKEGHSERVQFMKQLLRLRIQAARNETIYRKLKKGARLSSADRRWLLPKIKLRAPSIRPLRT